MHSKAENKKQQEKPNEAKHRRVKSVFKKGLPTLPLTSFLDIHHLFRSLPRTSLFTQDLI
jgi:hypothetical protein